MEVLAYLPAAAALGENTVYIVRHGNKNWCNGLGCLSDEGKERAQNLVSVFNGEPSDQHETFATPKALFAMHYNDGLDCERTYETIKPVADALHMNVNFKHSGGNPGHTPETDGGGNTGAAVDIKDTLKQTGGPVLVVWESSNIPFLAEQLGVENPPDWSYSVTGCEILHTDDFDSVWVLEFDDAQNLKSFHQSAQCFHQSEDCFHPSAALQAAVQV